MVSSSVFSQTDSLKTVRYTHEYEFAEGIYLNFYQVVNNSPLRVEQIFTSLNIYDLDFYKQISDRSKIQFRQITH